MVKPTLSRLFFGLVCTAVCSFNTIYAGVIYEKSFQGEEQEIGITLQWSTSTEENNSLFIIEKAEDGGDFESIGAIGGAGNSDELKEYNFFDFNIHGTYLLYRLKQMDEDGNVNYSKTLFINKVNENNFMVARMSDEMATDNFEVTIDMLINSDVEYQLTDGKGDVVMHERMSVNKGVNDIIIDMEGANEGTYKLTLTVGEDTEVLTFKKIKSTQQKNKSITAKKN